MTHGVIPLLLAVLSFAAAPDSHASPHDCDRYLAAKIRAEAVAKVTKQGIPDAEVSCAKMTRSLGLDARVACLQGRHVFMTFLAKRYRTLLDIWTNHQRAKGKRFRHYQAGQEMDADNFRWNVLEMLHKEGDFRGSFGHPVHDGMAEVMSPKIFPEAMLPVLRAQTRAFGEDLRLASGVEIPIHSPIVSPMLSISGMSFPQLTAPAHLVLTYVAANLARTHGVRILHNTGEGGPGLHLALLEGDAEALKKFLIEWNLERDEFKPGSWGEAEVTHFVDTLMAMRAQVFEGFEEEDFRRMQLVAQFGSALNGIRGPGNRVDFEKLRSIGQSPYVAMIQYKLKQAAKRGAKIDPSKIDHVSAAFRDIERDKPFKSPETNPDMDSNAAIARLIVATKLVTGKSVSLKYGVGNVRDEYEFWEYLRAADALPDHVQIEGRGRGFSPGSGNAPFGANTSLPAEEALIAVDAILKKLGIRERVYVESTGDIRLPADGVERLCLGADGISAARTWLGMALECTQIRSCSKGGKGGCARGIATTGDSLAGLSLDAFEKSRMGYQAAENWWKAYTQTLAETSLKDWRFLRQNAGLGAQVPVIRKKKGYRMVSLDRYYTEEDVVDLLRGALTPDEVRHFVFGRE